MTSFWAVLKETERVRLDAYLDVEPALCSLCHEVKRGVLLGVCEACLEAHDDGRGTQRTT